MKQRYKSTILTFGWTPVIILLLWGVLAACSDEYRVPAMGL